MSTHTATITWTRGGSDFTSGRYSREHSWTFDGGLVVPASPSPAVVPSPYSNPASVDPEEAYVAAISSCHMLTFLFLASRKGFEIESYADTAVGQMTKNERGVPWVSTVDLHPQVVFGSGRRPTPVEVADLHHAAHDQCFIAASIRTEVRVQGGGA